MKPLVLLTSMVCLTVVADISAGQIGAAADATNRSAEGKPPAAAAAATAEFWYITYLDQAVGLTDEQQDAMKGIIRARNKAMWGYQVQNAHRLRAAGNALLTAYRSMNGESIAKAQRDYQELQAPLHQLMKQAQDNMMEILTVDQQARLHEFQIVKAIELMAVPVKLSEDQIQKIKAAWPKAGDPKAGSTIYDQTVQETLTLDQKIVIAKYRAAAFVKTAFGPAKLTDEQVQQAENLAAELVQDPSVPPEDVRKKLSDEVNRLLTPEQQQAMQKPWGWNGNGPGESGESKTKRK